MSLYRRQALLGKVRLLRERLRTHTLTPERLELAAYLGDEAAQEALGEQAPHAPADLEGWVLGLEDYGREPLVLATFASVRFLLPLWTERYPADRRLAAALDAADAWAACPCASHARGASAAAKQAELAALDAARMAREHGNELRDEAAAAVAEAVCVVTEVVAGDPSSYTGYAATVAETVSSWEASVHGDVRDAIRATVIPWALARRS